jgi:hypothetical protein
MYSRLIAQIISSLLSGLNICMGDEIWTEMHMQLKTVAVETDNFYRNMVRCLDLGLPWICNIEFLQLVNESQAFLPRDADREKARA